MTFAVFLIAHNATVLTTNYMIRNGDVWVRHGNFVKPVSMTPGACLRDPWSQWRAQEGLRTGRQASRARSFQLSCMDGCG